jgi:hypothetical protein
MLDRHLSFPITCLTVHVGIYETVTEEQDLSTQGASTEEMDPLNISLGKIKEGVSAGQCSR